MTGCRFLLERLREKVAIVSLRLPTPEPQGLKVALAGQPREGSSLTWVVAPGSLGLRAEAPGYRPFYRTFVVDGGSSRTETVTLEKEAVLAEMRAPLPPETMPSSARLGGPLLIGTGAAGLVVAVVARLSANARYDEVKEQCERASCPPDAEARRSTVERLDVVAGVSALVGAGLVTSGVVWLAVSGGRDKATGATGVSVSVRGLAF
jgi:hypothetical protein